MNTPTMESVLAILDNHGYSIELDEWFDPSELAESLTQIESTDTSLTVEEKQELTEFIPLALGALAAWKAARGLHKYGGGNIIKGAGKLAGKIAGIHTAPARMFKAGFQKGNKAHQDYVKNNNTVKPPKPAAPAAAQQAAQGTAGAAGATHIHIHNHTSPAKATKAKTPKAPATPAAPSQPTVPAPAPASAPSTPARTPAVIPAAAQAPAKKSINYKAAMTAVKGGAQRLKTHIGNAVKAGTKLLSTPQKQTLPQALGKTTATPSPAQARINAAAAALKQKGYGAKPTAAASQIAAPKPSSVTVHLPQPTTNASNQVTQPHSDPNVELLKAKRQQRMARMSTLAGTPRSASAPVAQQPTKAERPTTVGRVQKPVVAAPNNSTVVAKRQQAQAMPAQASTEPTVTPPAAASAASAAQPTASTPTVTPSAKDHLAAAQKYFDVLRKPEGAAKPASAKKYLDRLDKGAEPKNAVSKKQPSKPTKPPNNPVKKQAQESLDELLGRLDTLL